jgi:hypothetical protein
VVSAERIPSDRLVYRWDLDKTYLRTEFDTLRDLIRTAIEAPSQKRTVPGAAALLREIRKTKPAAVHILSGSPEQMRSRLEAKLRLDGVVWDSFTLKPTLENILRGRFGFIREQLGYKLRALLESRSRTPVGNREILFGDDAEADAYVYSLYADIVAGVLDVSTLLEVLRRARVHPDDCADLIGLAQAIVRDDAVVRVFIHLERISASVSFDGFGSRVCAFYNYFQPALVLVEDGALDVDGALRVANELVLEHGFDADALAASHLDLVARGHVGANVSSAFVAYQQTFDSRQFPGAGDALGRTVQAIAGAKVPEARAGHYAPAEPIDYLGLFARDRSRAAQGKARARWKGRRG